MAKMMPSPSPVNDVRMLSTCPRMMICEPLGSSGRSRAMILSIAAATEPRSRRSVLANTSNTGWML